MTEEHAPGAGLDLGEIVTGVEALLGSRPSRARLILRATVLELVAECRRLRAELAQQNTDLATLNAALYRLRAENTALWAAADIAANYADAYMSSSLADALAALPPRGVTGG